MPGAELGALFKSFTRSAWRLETLDRYTVPSEDSWFADFQAGRPLPELTPDNDGWVAMLRDFRDTGRTCGRVHVVSQPVTDYVRFELALYRHSVAWGEDVRIADRGDHPGLATLDVDFWIFDDQTVAVMDYDDEGRFHGAHLADDDPERYREMRSFALAASMPLREFTDGLTVGP